MESSRPLGDNMGAPLDQKWPEVIRLDAGHLRIAGQTKAEFVEGGQKKKRLQETDNKGGQILRMSKKDTAPANKLH